jgi:hypothetical protein
VIGRHGEERVVLTDFARERGLHEVECRSCRNRATARSACPNCGGSGRLWASPNAGTLADSGLTRLLDLVSRDERARAAGLGFLPGGAPDRHGR